MGATELIQGLGRALAVLREAGHPQSVVQQLEDDITSLDAVAFRDAAEAEQWAARLVARLYGIAHPPAAAAEPVAPVPVTEPAPPVPAPAPAAAYPAPVSAQMQPAPAPDTHMATPAEVTGAAGP